MVKWSSEESKLRHSIPMVKRKGPAPCKACGKTISPGDECYYHEYQVQGLQYPARKYFCKACHDGVVTRNEGDAEARLISYYGAHPVD